MKPRRSGSGANSRKKRQVQSDEMEMEGEHPEEAEFIENAKRVVLGRQAAPSMITHMQVKPQAQAQAQAQAKLQPQPQLQAQTQVKPLAQLQTQPQEGGTVILKPPKQQRVKLQPKLTTTPPVNPQQSQTRRARRIRLTVANLAHRFTRAKRVHDDTEKKSSDTIRDYLIQKGVIQAKSKAPEKMLRSMYSDFMLLKDQAL